MSPKSQERVFPRAYAGELQDIATLSERVLRWCGEIVESNAQPAD